MARGKPKREKAAIPASYIRPRELPNGRTSYNVRAYDPATRTCKTLGTFKTKRAAERAFKRGPRLSSRTRAPSHRRRRAHRERRAGRPPPPPERLEEARALAPSAPRASARERRSSPSAAAERTSLNKRRRKTKNAKNETDAAEKTLGRRPRAAQKQARLRGVPHARQRRRRGVSVREPGRSGRSGAPRAEYESSRVRKPGGRVGEQPARRRRAHLLHPGGDAAADPPPRRRPCPWCLWAAGTCGAASARSYAGSTPSPSPGSWKTRPANPGFPATKASPKTGTRGPRPALAERLAAFLDPPRPRTR